MVSAKVIKTKIQATRPQRFEGSGHRPDLIGGVQFNGLTQRRVKEFDHVAHALGAEMFVGVGDGGGVITRAVSFPSMVAVSIVCTRFRRGFQRLLALIGSGKYPRPGN